MYIGASCIELRGYILMNIRAGCAELEGIFDELGE
jgi:hypothetical protein